MNIAQSVAHTILHQINSLDFWARARWGYNSPSRDDSSLSFKARGAKVGYCYVKVTLTPDDLYTIEVFKIRKFNRVTIEKLEGVYNDMLVEVIERMLHGRKNG